MNKIFNKSISLAFLIFTVGQNVYSQNFEFNNYGFSDSTDAIPPALANANEVILQRNIKTEIAVVGDTVKQYYLLHEKILINSDNAIERNNKVYIPFRMDESLLSSKVRVILKNGKSTELNISDIKEETNSETGYKYNYFAVTGLEKGAIIEKIFILEEIPDLNGKTIDLQRSQPVVHTSFELIFPAHLGFKFKSYNGLSDANLLEKAYGESKSRILLTAENIDPLPTDETYSNESAHSKIFRYKLDSNLASGEGDLYNYQDYAAMVYDNLYPKTDKKTETLVTSFISNIPLASDPTEQIRNIEYKIKSTISYNKYFEENSNFTDAITSRQANDLDMLRLYLAVFKRFNIENQIVMTSKRYQVLFDKDFETLEQIGDILLYFPACKKYIQPTAIEYRIPLFDFNYGDNLGLFIIAKEVDGIKTGVGEIKKIDIPDGNVTHDVTDIEVDFSKDAEDPEVHTTHTHRGYSALYYQVIKDYVPDDRYKEIMDEIAMNFTQNPGYKSLKTSNDGSKYLGKEPFIMDVTFDGNELIQKAGDNILFNAGVLIGRQMELYQADKRVLPVEMNFPHYYTRNIKVILPSGYTVQNPEVFDMKHSVTLDGKEAAGWVSSAKIENNILKVTNYEFYNVIHFPLSVFDDYKKVINAAADFNKIVVVLSKNKN